MTDGNEFISMRQAAESLGVHASTLSRLAQRGELSVYRRPVDRRQKFVRRNDVERLARIEPIVAGRVPHRPATRESGVVG